MEIRLARSSDIAGWATMRQNLWPEDTVDKHTVEAAELLEKTQQWAVWVAEKNGLVGFLEASLREYVDGCETSPVSYIEGIYVKPEFRRQGISRMLVREMENWAKSRGCTEVASDAELSNIISQQMHQQLGFNEVARIVIFRKEI